MLFCEIITETSSDSLKKMSSKTCIALVTKRTLRILRSLTKRGFTRIYNRTFHTTKYQNSSFGTDDHVNHFNFHLKIFEIFSLNL